MRAGLKPDGLLLDAGTLGAPRESTNLFMVGALAARSRRAAARDAAGRAVELLGRRPSADSVRAAVAAGYEKALTR